MEITSYNWDVFRAISVKPSLKVWDLMVLEGWGPQSNNVQKRLRKVAEKTMVYGRCNYIYIDR